MESKTNRNVNRETQQPWQDPSNSFIGPRKNRVYNRCLPCIILFKWCPVFFIACILAWGYYAFVVELCINTVDSVALKVIFLIFFHFFYIMTLWSYAMTIITEPGVVPKNFWLTISDGEQLTKEESDEGRNRLLAQIVALRELPVNCLNNLGAYRLCEKCNLIKPDRAHHCSMCNRCVLKMDHHCPWVNNCVSFSNYKYFVLFLGYTFSLCTFTSLVTLPYFLSFWENKIDTSGKFYILFLFFISLMFGISMVSLFSYHIYLVFKNRSTLEAVRPPILRYYGPDKNAYNLGLCKNWKQVFGDDKILWFLPIYTSYGDGLTYPTPRVHVEYGSNSRHRSASNGHTFGDISDANLAC